MSDKLTSEVILPFIHPATKQIEAENVLAILRTVAQRSASPVVRECLQEVCAEIAFLTSSEGTFEEYLALESPEERRRPPTDDRHVKVERPAI